MILAFDTETTPIPDRQKIRSRSGEEIAVSPIKVPDLVLGSVMDEGWDRPDVVDPEHLHDTLLGALNLNSHLVSHNFTFDYLVVTKAFPDLREPFLRAAEEGRLHDTLVLDWLGRLANGVFDRPVRNPVTGVWETPQAKVRSLDVLAQEYCGIILYKDPAIRLTYGQFLGRPLADLPVTHRRYAEDDARATLAVYCELRRRLLGLRAKNGLSEALQIRAALALADLDVRGVHVDRLLAARLAAQFEADLRPLQERLVGAGLGRWWPVPNTRRREPAPCGTPASDWRYGEGRLIRGRAPKSCSSYLEVADAAFSLNTSAIQRALAALPVNPDDPPPRRADGSISLDGKYWDSTILQGALHDWHLHEKVKKILATYLSVYSQTDVVFPHWRVLGPRSGRMAGAHPNIQNTPKRRAGIRALFVPSPGRVFVVADYSAQEMFTLCEVMLDMNIRGPLYKALTSGEDFHRLGAALVLGKDPEDVTKEERQAQKALHFGVPGGLGARKLAAYAWSGYGVDWTVEEAAARRKRFLDYYTDVATYLASLKVNTDTALRRSTGPDNGEIYWQARTGHRGRRVIREMINSTDPAVVDAGHRADRQLEVVLRSGRRRAHCRFTEGANTYFQGTAADVTKTAVWRAFRAGLQIVMVIHDEIVIESRPEHAADDAVLLEIAMKEAFRKICPRMGPYAGVEVKTGLDRWGPATDLQGKELTL